jgi:hypothetical protein
MATPAEKAARLSARLRSSLSTPGPEPVGEFLGVRRGGKILLFEHLLRLTRSLGIVMRRWTERSMQRNR